MPILRAGPSMDRWPARFHLRWQAPAFGAMAVAAGLAAIAPLASLIVLAFGETGDLWTHLARYVIPAALAQTALLLAGVAVVTIIIGSSTAWLVTTFAFHGRDALSWLLPRPAISVGVSLALLEALDDIGASEYLGVHTLTLSIFTTWLNRGSLAGAAQMACLMLLIVIALIALERRGRRRRGFAVSATDLPHLSPITLTGPARWIALIGCFVPVVLGFLLPAGYLLYEVMVRGLLVGFDVSLAGYALTTVALASIATAITLALGFSAVAALRYVKHPIIATSVNLAGIGYAVPGTVLALGLLSPLVLVDEGINALAQAFGAKGVGLVLAGSSAALIIAYVIRFLAIAIGFAQAGFSRISTELDDVARLLGAGPGTLARTIHLPLAQPAIFGAALLVFVDCLQELQATLLLRPLNVETLATYIYQFASRGSFEQGSLAALVIVAVGILPVIRITRYANIATRLRLDARS